jgi:hypothetical protein
MMGYEHEKAFTILGFQGAGLYKNRAENNEIISRD